MNVGYKHTPYNYKFFNCSWTVIHVYEKVHFLSKALPRATGLKYVANKVSPIKAKGILLA